MDARHGAAALNEATLASLRDFDRGRRLARAGFEALSELEALEDPRLWLLLSDAWERVTVLADQVAGELPPERKRAERETWFAPAESLARGLGVAMRAALEVQSIELDEVLGPAWDALARAFVDLYATLDKYRAELGLAPTRHTRKATR